MQRTGSVLGSALTFCTYAREDVEVLGPVVKPQTGMILAVALAAFPPLDLDPRSSGSTAKEKAHQF